MNDLIGPKSRQDLIRRGFTRRDFGRLAAFLTAGAALPFYNEAALAQGLSAMPSLPPDAVQDQRQRKPDGPLPRGGRGDSARSSSKGAATCITRRSPSPTAMAEVEGLSRDHVMPFAGSSDPLHRAVLAFTGPDKSFVVADPGYEAGETSRRTSSAPGRSRCRCARIGLTTCRPWPQADPNAGVIYVCNPNNPTGSVTPKDDIEYLVANKPARVRSCCSTRPTSTSSKIDRAGLVPGRRRIRM